MQRQLELGDKVDREVAIRAYIDKNGFVINDKNRKEMLVTKDRAKPVALTQ